MTDMCGAWRRATQGSLARTAVAPAAYSNRPDYHGIAQNVRFWHLADIPRPQSNVRFRG
jgi:hypothetical protein